MKQNREYREMELRFEPEGAEYRVDGYASTFEPYKLMEVDGISYYEKIEPTAFDEADLLTMKGAYMPGHPQAHLNCGPMSMVLVSVQT